MSKASYGIDWLRGTVVQDYSERFKARHLAQRIFGDIGWTDAERSPFSYNVGVECDFCGIYWHSEHAEFGMMINASGSQMSALREAGISATGAIKQLHDLGWTVKRLDLALDIYDRGGRPKELYDGWRIGSVKTKARSVTIVQSRSTGKVKGETVYIGSRQSPVYLRVYDKAAEQGKNDDIIRVELELKQERANLAALSVVKQGIPKTMAALLREHITVGMPTWITDALEVEFSIVAMTSTRDTNFERWFYSTVVPAVEKAVRLNLPDAEQLIANAIKSGKEI